MKFWHFFHLSDPPQDSILRTSCLVFATYSSDCQNLKKISRNSFFYAKVGIWVILQKKILLNGLAEFDGFILCHYFLIDTPWGPRSLAKWWKKNANFSLLFEKLGIGLFAQTTLKEIAKLWYFCFMQLFHLRPPRSPSAMDHGTQSMQIQFCIILSWNLGFIH